jgi:hypothetical protein
MLEVVLNNIGARSIALLITQHEALSDLIIPHAKCIITHFKVSSG